MKRRFPGTHVGGVLICFGLCLFGAFGGEFYVDTWDGVNVVLPFDGTHTVGEVKLSLESCRGIPVGQQQLYSDTQLLPDGLTLAGAGVEPGDTLDLLPQTPFFTGLEVAETGTRLHTDGLLQGAAYEVHAKTSLVQVAEWECVESFPGDWGAGVFNLSPTNLPNRFFKIATTYTNGTWASLSRGMALTYTNSAPDFRQLRVAASCDGAYWVGMSEYDSSDPPVYLMKCDPWGRTLVPPFKVTVTLGSAGDSDDSYAFTLTPMDGGGVELLTSEEDPYADSSSDPNILKAYEFDADGVLLSERRLLHFDGSSDTWLRDLWSVRTVDGRTLFTAEHGVDNKKVVFGTVDGSGASALHTIYDNGSHSLGNVYSESCYDAANNSLLTFVFNYTGDQSILYRFDLDGSLLQTNNLTALFGANIPTPTGRRVRLLLTASGLLLTQPCSSDPFRLLLLDPVTLAVINDIEMDDFNMTLYSPDPRYAVADAGGGEILLTWSRNIDGHRAVLSARIHQDGTLLSEIEEISPPDMRSDPRNVFLFVREGVPTVFYQYNPGHEWELVAEHAGADHPAGMADLVLSAGLLEQSPFYALLDSQVALKARVVNQGETASSAATLRLSLGAAQDDRPVSALAPGQSVEIVFTNATPAFLSEEVDCTLTLLGDDGWDFNNTITNQFRFPPSTPVYPSGSTNYTWTVQDKVTHAPIQWAYYTLTLSNMTTLANGERNVVLTDWADSSGQFQTVLPPGTHRYRVSRSGYPTTFFDISVPSPASTIFELEPPGSISCSFQDQDTGGMLNPAPAGAALRLSGHVGGYSAEGHGDWMGLEMEEVMPGAYTGTVSAVGYEDFPVSLVVTGGVTNAFEFVLDPLPRGTVSGFVKEDGSPVQSATVKVSGFSSLQYETASDGSFSITNVPYGSRTCVVKKDGYRTAATPVSVSQSSQSVGIVALQAISDEELNLGAWTTTCFNRVEEVPGTFFGPGYKVTCSFGVFDATASLFTERSGNAAVLDSLLLDIEGFKWYYYSVSSSFSLTDLAFAQLDDVSSAVGDLCMTMVDLSPAASGFFSFLSVNIGAGGCGGQTVVRVDRVVILEDGSPVWDSYERLDQRYSTSSPLSYAIDADVSDITEVVIRIYAKVTNENYCIGPLFLRDKIRFEWKWDGNGFKFQKPKTNPSDYPSFSFD